MSFGKGSTPSAPNYTALANQTAAANRDATMLQTGLNRPTELNPYGARQWALKPGADPNNPQPGDWVVSDSLSPDQQQILDLRENTQIGMGQAANAGTQRLNQMMGTGVDTSNLPQRYQGNIPNSEQAFSDDRRRVEDAVYGSLTNRLGTQFGRDEAAERSRLSNAGLMEGSEAYNNAMSDFARRKDDAYSNAAMQAVQAGGAEQSRQYGNLLSGVQASDTTRGNALNEQLQLRQLPINELNALLSGTQVGGSGGGAGFANAGLAASPDYMQAANAQYQAGMDAYNARAAGAGNLLNAGTTLGSAYLMRASDRRLKSNIKEIGKHSNGLKVYEYDIEGRRERGFMADEVETIMPEAVHYRDDGFAMVDYGMLGGRP